MAFDEADPGFVAAAMLNSIDEKYWSPDEVKYWMSRMIRMSNLATKIQAYLSANQMGDFSPKAVADRLSIASLDAAREDARLPPLIRQEATSFLDTIPEYVADAQGGQTQKCYDQFGYAAMLLWGTLSRVMYGTMDFSDGHARIEDTKEERVVIFKILSPKYWCGDLPQAIKAVQEGGKTSFGSDHDRAVGLERLDDMDTRASFPFTIMMESRSDENARLNQQAANETNNYGK